MFKKILVPLDGSKLAEKILSRVEWLAKIHDAEVTLPAMSLRRGKSLVGVFMGATRPRVDIPRYVELWQRGLLDLDSMVSDVIPLDEVNAGFAALSRGEVARAVVAF